MYRSMHMLVVVVVLAMAAIFPAFGQGDAGNPAPPSSTEAQPQPVFPPRAWRGDANASMERPSDPASIEVSLDFVKADLTNVLGFLSLASGIPIITDADVKGTVTITGVQKVPLSLAYDVINSALRVRGYTMVGTLRDTMIRVVPLKKAIADRAVVQVGADLDKIGTGDAIITQVIPLQYISAAKLRDELKPLVADDQANMLAVSSTNTLIITDTEGNVRRLVQIINILDKDTSDVVDVEVYQCKYASAPVLVSSLEKVLNTANSSATRMNQPNRGEGGPPPEQGGPPPSATSSDGVLSLKGELRISADERTNAIIISASRPKIDMVLGLIAKLDVNTTSEVHAKIFHLQYADATIVANQLNTLFEQPQGGNNNRMNFMMWGMPDTSSASKTDYAGLKRNMIVADVRSNSVVVTATEQNMQQFESMIRDLDSPTVLSDITRTFQLKYANATELASTLNSLFRGNTQRGFSLRDLFSNTSNQTGDPIASLKNITVVADSKSNTLLFTGPPQAFSMIEGILTQLDRRTVQVFIEVAIVDVTLDNTTKFGIEWTWNSDEKAPDGTTPRETIGTNFGLSSEKLGLRYSIISDNLKALLHALQTRSDVRVYSTPSITTADNVPAKISIGQDVPFVSSSEETSGGNFRQTVEFKNVSIALNVTPHVNETSDLINLDVQQTINELIGTEAELNAPIIANREAKTTVMVDDGQTIVIGGIIKQNRERELNAVPILSKIPLLGEAFKSRTWRNTQSELMVFLTPHILRDEQSTAEITKQAQQRLSDPFVQQVPAAQQTPSTQQTPGEK